MRRLRLCFALIALLLVLPTAPAGAAGVSGVDLAVELPTAGRRTLAVGTEPVTGYARITNFSSEERSVRLHAVAVYPDPDSEAVDFGAAGSAAWLGLGDHHFDLAPGDERLFPFTIQPRRLEHPRQHAAVVLELGSGTTVVTQAAEIIRVDATGPLGNATAPFIIAVLLLLALLAAHLLRRRLESRRRHELPVSGRDEVRVPVPTG